MKEIHFKTINSTNKYLMENHDLDDLTFVSADYQTDGKGREARKWFSSPGDNLLFSLLIKDENLTRQFSHLSLLTAVAIFKVLTQIGIKNVAIKWPNDVYINDKKVCGILLNGSLPNYLVIGVGLNVKKQEFLGEYRVTPTSIFNEIKSDLSFTQIKDLVYSTLLKEINDLSNGDYSYLSIVRKHNYLLNKIHTVLLNGKIVKAKIIGIADDGQLIISYHHQNYNISSGEIE